jgi:hypothetical protein
MSWSLFLTVTVPNQTKIQPKLSLGDCIQINQNALFMPLIGHSHTLIEG